MLGRHIFFGRLVLPGLLNLRYVDLSKSSEQLIVLGTVWCRDKASNEARNPVT
jgi:hypothetical protein